MVGLLRRLPARRVPRRRARRAAAPHRGERQHREGRGHRHRGAEAARRARPRSSRSAPRSRAPPPASCRTWRPRCVPTATTVRAVPAKLLADNRIVINNHLARARGGKVSFTHLIGYALVRALADVPVMNNSFAEVDGKPRSSRPTHVSLGLAIDLQNANGTRSLVVAAHQGRRHDGLRAVLGGVRGHRAPRPRRQAHHRRLRRHHDQPDQPRRHRHRALGAAAHAGAGRDHRRRRDGVPRRVPGRVRGDARPARGQQDRSR